MKKLKPIKIDWLSIPVEFQEEVLDPSDQGHCFGQIHWGRAHHPFIKVATEYSEERQKVTLLHEVIHAIDYARLGDQLDEHQVRLFAESFYMLLKDNPHLLKFIWQNG